MGPGTPRALANSHTERPGWEARGSPRAGGLESQAASELLPPRQPEEAQVQTFAQPSNGSVGELRSQESKSHWPVLGLMPALSCIRAIMGRAWGWEWTSCPCLGSPCQGCPQWGNFTHSTGCCRVPGHHNWPNIPHGGDGAQRA